MTERRVVLIAGASGGIGVAIAEAFAADDYLLALHYRRNAEPVERLVEQIGSDRAIAIAADITTTEGCRTIVENTLERYGRLDVFVHSVGSTARYQRFLDLSLDLVRETVETELMSVINTTRAVLPLLQRAANGGRIVLVGSDSGKVGTTGETISAACRAGIIGFAKSIAREHARDNILMNVVCPGPVETPLWQTVASADEYSGSVAQKIAQATPLRRVAKASEIANAIVFLASEKASFITGQAISVSGGLTMCS